MMNPENSGLTETGKIPLPISDTQLISRRNALLFAASRKGWVIAAEGEWGIQFLRSKTYKPIFLWLGLALIVFGVGLLVWIWGYLEYLCRRDQVFLVPIKELNGEKLDSIYRRLNLPH